MAQPARHWGGEALAPAPCAPTPGSLPPAGASAASLPVTAGAAGSGARADVGDLGESPARGGQVWASGGVQAETGGPRAQPLRPGGSRAYDAAAKAAVEAGGGGGGKEGRDKLARGEGRGEGGAGGGDSHRLAPPPSPPTGLEGAALGADFPRPQRENRGTQGKGSPRPFPYTLPGRKTRPPGRRESPALLRTDPAPFLSRPPTPVTSRTTPPHSPQAHAPPPSTFAPALPVASGAPGRSSAHA